VRASSAGGGGGGGGGLTSAAGNVLGHLDRLKYQVSVKQSPLDEYDVRVRDVTRDLRDGVVLAFVAKTYAGVNVVPSLRVRIPRPPGDWLTGDLRAQVPATSRVHKLANVGKLLQALEAQAGLELDTGRRGKITNRDVVDGNRDKTLALVWKLTVRFSLGAWWLRAPGRRLRD
jgi:hypothetical protein